MIAGILAVFCSLPIYASLTLFYWETKWPFKIWMQVVDLEGDGELDALLARLWGAAHLVE